MKTLVLLMLIVNTFASPLSSDFELEADDSSSSSSEEEDSCPYPNISFSSTNQYNSRYALANLFSNTCEEEPDDEPPTFWITKDDFKGTGFIMDLGHQYCIREITLKNTHNRSYRDRATDNFTIQVSNAENGGFKNLLTSKLEDSRALECNSIPLHTYHVSKCFRYLRFIVNSYYGNGGGLNYFNLQ